MQVVLYLAYIKIKQAIDVYAIILVSKLPLIKFDKGSLLSQLTTTHYTDKKYTSFPSHFLSFTKNKIFF
jgi:hypothetical protein